MHYNLKLHKPTRLWSSYYVQITQYNLHWVQNTAKPTKYNTDVDHLMQLIRNNK